ncbi:MAG: acyl carrier protein [Myxococcota bacterium]
MSKEEILDQVTALLVQSFDLDPSAVHPTANLIDDLDLDSIDAIDLVVGLEEETGLAVSEDEIRKIRVVQDVVDLIHRRLGDGQVS